MKKIISKAKDFLSENEILTFGKSHKTLIFLSLMMVSGMILGAILAGCISFEILDNLNGIFMGDFKTRVCQNSAELFVSSFSVYFMFAAFLGLSALSVWGAVSIPLVICFRGIGIGVSGGYLYLIHGFKSIAFYVLILVPGIFVSSIAFVLFGTHAFKTSLKFAKLIFPKFENIAQRTTIKLKIKKFGYSLMLLGFSAFLDMCFMMMFSGFFEF